MSGSVHKQQSKQEKKKYSGEEEWWPSTDGWPILYSMLRYKIWWRDTRTPAGLTGPEQGRPRSEDSISCRIVGFTSLFNFNIIAMDLLFHVSSHIPCSQAPWTLFSCHVFFSSWIPPLLKISLALCKSAAVSDPRSCVSPPSSWIFTSIFVCRWDLSLAKCFIKGMARLLPPAFVHISCLTLLRGSIFLFSFMVFGMEWRHHF